MEGGREATSTVRGGREGGYQYSEGMEGGREATSTVRGGREGGYQYSEGRPVSTLSSRGYLVIRWIGLMSREERGSSIPS